MEKKNTVCLAAFERQNGRWAIATEANGEIKILSAFHAHDIAGILQGQAGKASISRGLAAWFQINFTDAVIPLIAGELVNLAKIVDRENSRDEWPVQLEVQNADFFRDTGGVH